MCTLMLIEVAEEEKMEKEKGVVEKEQVVEHEEEEVVAVVVEEEQIEKLGGRYVNTSEVERHKMRISGKGF